MAVDNRLLLLSIGYWFSSRTLGLLHHPYITMRAITRERFMRPLVLSPLLFWLLSWCLGMVLTRAGMLLRLGRLDFANELSLVLLFVWVWGSLFVLLWQMVLGYLYWRFRRIA